MTHSKVLLYLLIICAVFGQSISLENPDNFECASIHLSDNKTIVQISNNEIIDQKKFEIIRAGRLENAKFFVRKYPQKKCLLEICGYNSQDPESPYYYGNCDQYNSSSNGEPTIANSTIYKNDYDLSSTSCSCMSPSSSCVLDSCLAKFTSKTWKDDECAFLFQEKNCTTCNFPTTNLSHNKSVYTLNAKQIRSMFIRPGCRVDTVIKNGLDRNEEWSTDTINYGLGKLVLPSIGEAVYKDTDNFTCCCESNVMDSSLSTSSDNLEYVTDTTISSPSGTSVGTIKDKKGSNLTFSNYIILIGGVVILVAVLCFLMLGFKMKRKCQNGECCKSTFENIDSSDLKHSNVNTDISELDSVQPNSSGISSENTNISKYSAQTAHSLNAREMQLKAEIMDGFKQLMESIIPSNGSAEYIASPDRKHGDSNLLQLYEIYNPDYDVSRDSIWISKRNLEHPLGSGQFGIVYKGILKNKTDGLEKMVAVKKMNWHTHSDEKIVQSFIQEVKTFHAIDNGNENIVQYIGACCHSDGLYILTQYCEHGSLKSFLSHNLGPKILSEQTGLSATEFTNSVGDDYFAEDSMQNHKPGMSTKYLGQFFRWCDQIANGMNYLGGKGIIHVDLAIRNVLVSSLNFINGKEKYDIKICDFGLSKRCLDKENYAKSLLSGDFPFNSFAPECVSDKPKQISIYLDVWAYGCTLWEIFMLGDSLYPDVTESGIHKFLAVKKLLQEGYKHPKPLLAPEYVYNETILKCWERVPRNRPNFTELRDFFKMRITECV